MHTMGKHADSLGEGDDGLYPVPIVAPEAASRL